MDENNQEPKQVEEAFVANEEMSAKVAKLAKKIKIALVVTGVVVVALVGVVVVAGVASVKQEEQPEPVDENVTVTSEPPQNENEM